MFQYHEKSIRAKSIYFLTDLNSEFNYLKKYNIYPIGTFCHELGHVLGLPDLYDTSENSAAGIGVWGLMGAGNWQRQTSPAYMSAWSRYRLGFTHPIILENVSNLEISLQVCI